jgi:uroporphyrin-III C-methyltransferase
MNESTETPASTQSAPESAPVPRVSYSEPPAPQKGVPTLSILSLVLALGAAGASGWQWWENRNLHRQTEALVAQKLKAVEQTGQQALALSREAQQTARELHARFGLLENSLAESKDQQLALEALYQELAGSRDAWVLADIEQVLLMAEQQLQLAGNVKAAIIALESAETRIARLDKPQFLTLRKAILADMERLKTAPRVDTTGLALRIDQLLAGVDELKPGFEAPLQPAASGVAQPSSHWRSALGRVWEEIKQLVRVRRLEQAEAPLLAPDQIWFLRQNLKLRLLSARLALFARDQTSFTADLTAARSWVERYFLKDNAQSAHFLDDLARIGATQVSVTLPDIAASLEAVRILRTGTVKEKG